MATCRDCALFDLDACKDKAGRVLRNRVGWCGWKSKGAWPASVLGSRPTTRMMQPDEGHGCPCFIKREDF